MSYLKTLLVVALVSVGWAALALYGGLSGWWLESKAEPGDVPGFVAVAREMIEESSAGSVAGLGL